MPEKSPADAAPSRTIDGSPIDEERGGHRRATCECTPCPLAGDAFDVVACTVFGVVAGDVFGVVACAMFGVVAGDVFDVVDCAVFGVVADAFEVDVAPSASLRTLVERLLGLDRVNSPPTPVPPERASPLV